MKVKPCKHSAHEEPHQETLDSALEQLRSKGLRVTPQRRQMLAALIKSHKPLSADELFQHLPKGSSDQATVFRSLSGMEEAGILQKQELGDGIRRYEVAEKSHHHHYIHCRSCGAVEAFDGCVFDKSLSRSLARKGYQKIQHNLEVMALCSSCA